MTITSSSLWEWRKVQSLFLFPQRIGITNPACGVLNYSHKEMQICPISKKLDNEKNNQKAQVFQVCLFLLYTITDTSLPHTQ